MKSRSTRPREEPIRANARRTRARLLRAGKKAFAAKGMGGASLRDDILVKAGVSAGSFYHQFVDKEDLLLEVLRVDGEAVLVTLVKGVHPGRITDEKSALEQARRLISNLFDMGDGYPEFVKIYAREYYSDSPAVQRAIRSYRRRNIEALRAGYERLSDITRVPLDAEAIATLVWVQGAAVVNYYLDTPKRQRPQVRAQLTRSMLEQAAGGVLAVREVGEGGLAEAVAAGEAGDHDDEAPARVAGRARRGDLRPGLT